MAHGYGMTECPMISQGSPHDSDDQLAYTDGHPVHGCEVSIVSHDGTEAPAGTVGEVRVSGPMLFAGYTDPALDEDAFDEQGRFRTGDLGVMSPDAHLTLTGRLKDIIIRKGENISAKEIEDVLYAHPTVGAAAVIGLPDAERGELVWRRRGDHGGHRRPHVHRDGRGVRSGGPGPPEGARAPRDPRRPAAAQRHP